MRNVRQAIWVETLKARRSVMPPLTLLGFLLLPLVGGLFMIILKDPAFARRVGLIGAKAQLTAGEASWPSFLNLLAQGVAIGGVVLVGFIGAWVFGREFANRTAKDLLALPTDRPAIVLAKLVVIVAWSAALMVVVFIVGLGIGAAVNIPGLSPEVFREGAVAYAGSAVLTIALVTPIAFIASAGHGYLPPIAGFILAIFLAQVMVIIGWGEYFPWSVPALFSQGVPLDWASYLLVLVTSAAGLAATVLWWQLADQTH
jgi:ABC-2 type transport system permease protein